MSQFKKNPIKKMNTAAVMQAMRAYFSMNPEKVITPVTSNQSSMRADHSFAVIRKVSEHAVRSFIMKIKTVSDSNKPIRTLMSISLIAVSMPLIMGFAGSGSNKKEKTFSGCLEVVA